jgi:hypothetical protein
MGVLQAEAWNPKLSVPRDWAGGKRSIKLRKSNFLCENVEEFEIAHFDISETGSLKLHVVFCTDKYNLYTRRRFSGLVREKMGVVFFTSTTCTQEEGSQNSSGKRREWYFSLKDDRGSRAMPS